MSSRSLPTTSFSSELPQSIGRPANAALVARGITTLGQVAAMTERQLLDVHGVGPKAVRILRTELRARGMDLAD